MKNLTTSILLMFAFLLGFSYSAQAAESCKYTYAKHEITRASNFPILSVYQKGRASADGTKTYSVTVKGGNEEKCNVKMKVNSECIVIDDGSVNLLCHS